MKRALITGANRGIGLEFVKQLKTQGYEVVGCCRQPDLSDKLHQYADTVLKLDLRLDDDIRNLQEQLQGKPIDLLVNNAGIAGQQGVTVGHIDRENFHRVLDVNCVGTILLTDALLPLIQASEDKQVLVISSSMGSITENERGRSYAYRTSKAALNCVMRSFAIDVQEKGIKVMLIHPGWVKTDMGGQQANLNVADSVRDMLQQVNQYMHCSHADVIRRFDGGTIPW